MNNEMKRIREKSTVAEFEVLCPHMHGGIADNHKTLFRIIGL
jgi:hypothetical protein